MTNREMQLAPYTPSGQMVAPWEQPFGAAGTGLGAPAAPNAQQTTPFKKVHRLLRGRYILAFFLALVGAAAGGAAGYLSQRPGYGSTGTISISGVLPSPEQKDAVIQMYAQHMAKQVTWLSGERLLGLAIKRPEFKAVKQFNTPDPVREFSDNLKVVWVRGTDQINVTYTDPDPAVAQLAVKAVIRTYDEHFRTNDLSFVNEKFEFWNKSKTDAETRIAARRREIDEIINESHWGTDNLQPLITSKQNAQIGFETEVLTYKQQLETLKTGKAQELSVDDIARVDATMLSKIRARDELRAGLARLRLTMLENNPTVVRVQKELQNEEQAIEEAARDFRKKWVVNLNAPAATNPNGTAASLQSRDPATLQVLLDIAQKKASDNRSQTEQFGKWQRQIDDAKAAIADETEKLKEAHRELERLRFQKDGIGKVTIMSDGSQPAVAVDNRIKFGAVGFLAGGGLPIALLMLVGLMDRRYRYSDEPGVDVSGITLLGILPNLPDRLSDPEQAAIAAHCVHQIRTMLQINGSSLGAASQTADEERDRRVFAVTSANPGDGKTSLTLALGLSYAACGTRTLLVDCDLVGGGLTSRMNVNAPEGVLEAIADRSLLPYVRSTDIADVSILPVGNARGHHASTLSPGALRRLIDEAKKHFEVIMIDTGPILGSIEASLVCAAVDGVVLAVARGQQRPMVEKALSHLAAIGARLAGVVFNRAQANDFERSISGMSIRSIARMPATTSGNGHNGSGNGHGNGHGKGNGGGYGPVAKAVAGAERH